MKEELLAALVARARRMDWTNADVALGVVVSGCWVHGFGSIIMEARVDPDRDGVRAWTRSRVHPVRVGRETEWLECRWSTVPGVDAAVEAHMGIVPQDGLVDGPAEPKRDTTGGQPA
jgi:hypothetical protein